MKLNIQTIRDYGSHTVRESDSNAVRYSDSKNNKIVRQSEIQIVDE